MFVKIGIQIMKIHDKMNSICKSVCLPSLPIRDCSPAFLTTERLIFNTKKKDNRCIQKDTFMNS